MTKPNLTFILVNQLNQPKTKINHDLITNNLITLLLQNQIQGSLRQLTVGEGDEIKQTEKLKHEHRNFSNREGDWNTKAGEIKQN